MGNQSHCARTRLSSSNMRAFFVGAAIVGAASASELKLTWGDCGDSSTHTKITSFTPSSITTGRKATMTGTGNLDEDVSGANFDLEMKTAAGTVSCKGDASQSKTCHLPLGTGALTFNAMLFPIPKGSTSVSVDLSLSAMLPGALAHTETKVRATATTGDDIFCMDIKSAPAVDELVVLPPSVLPASIPPSVDLVQKGNLTCPQFCDECFYESHTGKVSCSLFGCRQGYTYQHDKSVWKVGYCAECVNTWKPKLFGYCPNGFYVSDTCKTCQECPAEGQECGDPYGGNYHCCAPGLGCIEQRDMSTMLCTACPEHCKRCAGTRGIPGLRRLVCDECEAGYQLSDGSCSRASSELV